MSRLRLARHRRTKFFALTAASIALALALLVGCPASDRTSSTSLSGSCTPSAAPMAHGRVAR